MPAVFEYRHTVRDDETDELRHTSNVAYIEWMLAAAVAHSAAQGWPAGAYLERGAGWVVRSHTIEYLRPSFAGDRITVRTWVGTMDAATSIRRYRILAEDGSVLARAETKWAFIDFTSRRPVRIPPEIAGAFPVVDDGNG